MERVSTLINKLKDQLDQGTETNKLIVTAQMLLAELQQQQPACTNGKVSVIVPVTATNIKVEEEVVKILSQVIPVQGKEIPVVTNEEKKVEQLNWFNEPVHTIPTLVHQPQKEVFELNDVMVMEEEVVNDKMKEKKIEVGTLLQNAPVKDLKKAIGLNDRYLFINELFRGDEAMYERSIKTINNYNFLPEAQYWIQRELKVKLSWPEESETVKQFDQLVSRRFS
jgi:hypothetical protein